MTAARSRRLLLGLISLTGLVTASFLSRAFYRTHPQDLWFDYYLLPPVPVLRIISLGQDAALADLLYTSTTMTPDYFRDLDERARIVTVANATAFQLDPDFEQAIYYGHYFVEFEKFRGRKSPREYDPRKAAASEISFLLLTGFHASNDSGQFATVAAQEQLSFKKFNDVLHLARLALAKEPDALIPENLIAVGLLKDGDDNGAKILWEDMERKTAAMDTREAKYFHAVSVMKLLYLREKTKIDALEKIILDYQAAHGHNPVSWGELINARLLRAVPQDSRGIPFILNNATGKVQLLPPTAKEAFK
jgi:hypothetical protein